MVERRLDVYCLSNMGLHVLIDGHSILIDALNNGEQRPYAGIPLDMAQTISRGGPPYERVDMMLISHHHEDHFDAGEASCARLFQSAGGRRSSAVGT